MSKDSPAERVLAYHERTKHHPQRYARSLGYMDWETQPEPFRTFPTAERIELPLAADALTTPYGALYQPGAVPAAPLTRVSIGTLFELSLGLSAWKEYQGARWALRCTPSSGNLHPTEGYLLVGEGAGLPPGLHHYGGRDHLLERRGVPDAAATERLTALLGPTRLFVGLSSVVWREAWKYGERAYRYCQHDAGHALGALRYAAAALGWRARLLDEVADDDLAALLGLNAGVAPDDFVRPDPEYAEALVLIETGAALESALPAAPPWPPALAPAALGAALRALTAGFTFVGRPEPPSTATVEWEVLPEVIAAAARPTAAPAADRGAPESEAPAASSVRPAASAAAERAHPVAPPEPAPEPPVAFPGDAEPAARLMRQRRSAVAMDGTTHLSAAAFFRLLARLLPRPGVPPWDLHEAPPRLHPVLFVHRVVDVPAGLYLLARRPGVVAPLRAALAPEFAWDGVAGAPAGLPLFRLAAGDFRARAAAISCDQEIAGEGALSIGMLAEFSDRIRGRSGEGAGAWHYPRLFREAGLVGHALYLEAEAVGVRATGIGCYFDDLFHHLLGLGRAAPQEAAAFQSLYHFTIGGPVEDDRLITRAPYAHLADRSRVP